MIGEECTKTLDRASPLLFTRFKRAHTISSSPPAEPDDPSQKHSITVEQFLRAQARKPTKRRKYKRTPKVTTQSDLERLKEADSSFAREEDQLFSDDDDPSALPTKRSRKTQSDSNHQTAGKRRTRRQTKEATNVVQPLELQEEPLPNIATRSLHERWHPVDSRKGRPFIQPTFASGRRPISLAPLKPAPVLPPIWTSNSPLDSLLNLQDLSPTTKVPGKKAYRSTRTALSMEPRKEHERKLKSWKRSVRRLRCALLISHSATKFKDSR